MSRDRKYKDRYKKRKRDYDDDDDDRDDDDDDDDKKYRRRYEKSKKDDLWSDAISHLSAFGSDTIRIILKTLVTLGISLAAIPIFIWGPKDYGFPIVAVVLMSLILFFMWSNSGTSEQSELSEQEIDKLKKEIEALKQTLADHEKRLENTEIIESFENRLARKELEKKDQELHSKPILTDDTLASEDSVAGVADSQKH